MIAQRTITTTSVVQNSQAAVQEAMRLLVTRTTPQRWVCEVCGMVHTGAAPHECDSCGTTTALVQQAELHREMNSRW
jgi:rubrerythrin